MIKRLLALPFMILYMFSISGAMLQIHFCDQKFESFTINQLGKTCCCEDKSASAQHQEIKMTNADCCTDQTVVIQSVTDQMNASAFQFLFSSYKLLTLQSDINQVVHPQLEWSTPITFATAQPPPGLWQDIPLFMLHQHILYYC